MKKDFFLIFLFLSGCVLTIEHFYVKHTKDQPLTAVRKKNIENLDKSARTVGEKKVVGGVRSYATPEKKEKRSILEKMYTWSEEQVYEIQGKIN